MKFDMEHKSTVRVVLPQHGFKDQFQKQVFDAVIGTLSPRCMRDRADRCTCRRQHGQGQVEEHQADVGDRQRSSRP